MKPYLNTEPYRTHRLKVSELHTLYVEECGNPDGEPVVFLHGGPGGCVSEKSRRFFDPEYYRIVLFDQRGCGKSTPFAELEENNIFHLVEDIEKIRSYLGIESWYVFGGSFGSTLALTYAISHPEYVRALILRGIFLAREEDILWLYQEGASYLFPDVFEPFREHIAKDRQDDLVGAYYEKLTHEDEEVRRAAAKKWSDWEGSIITLLPPATLPKECTNYDMSIARLECHYFVHRMSWNDDNYILNRIDRISKIRTYIVHGRYDVDCRPSGAYELHKALPNSELTFVDAAGHSPYEEGMFDKLLSIMEELKKK
ncbi:MAG: prolyl aminopeptidase [Filifactor alocis]|nr:prolyl aminopeptidase [Filifactor alocis]